MVAIPPVPPPVRVPVDIPMGAAVLLVLVHVPPAGVDVSVVVLPTHADVEPPIAVGVALMVTTRVVAQPVVLAWKVITDVPAAIPVTIPVVPTVALAPSLLHMPPVVLLERVVVAPSHTTALPFILAGGVFIVIVVVVIQPPVL